MHIAFARDMSRWARFLEANALALLAASGLLIACGGPDGSPASHTGPIDAAPDAAPGGEAGVDGADVSCTPDVTLEPGVVLTDRGAVRGARAGNGYVFKGIPYAASPVGALRWRAPSIAPCWQGIRDATSYGSECVQYSVDGNSIIGDENCLTLNVWSPDVADKTPLPILVFIHGGSNVRGSSSQQLFGIDVYDGQYLAENGPAVVVTLNYRIGAMGFLTHPALANENELGAAGNYGLMDQIAALEWVQKNIAAFGGDRSRVLVFGQSAGAIDICSLIASNRAAGLFSRAAMHSGSCSAGARDKDEAIAKIVAGRLGCTSGDVAACLRGKTAVEVASATSMQEIGGGLVYHPTVDGLVLHDQPLAILEAGAHNHVPFIIGNTGNEMAVLIRAYVPSPVTSEAEYQAVVEKSFGTELGPQVLAQYPSTDYSSPEAALEALFADVAFGCPSRRVARTLAASQSEAVRRFVFTHGFENGPLVQYGAAHGFDLLFAMHHLGITTIPASADEIALADSMVHAWTRFAASGDPNGDGSPDWPTYDPVADSYLTLEVPTSTGAGFHSKQCDFWDGVQ